MATAVQQMSAYLWQHSPQVLRLNAEELEGQCDGDWGDGPGRVHRALCRGYPSWVCATEFSETDEGYALQMSWGTAANPVRTVTAVGDDLLALVRTLTEQISPATGWRRRMMMVAPEAERALAQTMAMRHVAPIDRTLLTVEACFQALPDAPEWALLRAALLVDLCCYEAARSAALNALAHCERHADVQHLQGIRTLRVLGAALLGLAQLSSIRPALEHVLLQDPPSQLAPSEHRHLSHLWLSLGDCCIERREVEAACHAYEQAADLALHLRQQGSLLKSRNGAALAHRLAGRHQRAQEESLWVMQAGTAAGLTLAVQVAMMNLSTIEACQANHAQSVAWAERAMALSIGAPPKYHADAAHRLASASNADLPARAQRVLTRD